MLPKSTKCLYYEPARPQPTMTDDEIFDLMYEHADAFSSCVQFSEQGVLDFARAVLNHTGALVTPTLPEPPGYTDDLWTFIEGVDRYIP